MSEILSFLIQNGSADIRFETMMWLYEYVYCIYIIMYMVKDANEVDK